MTTRKWFILLMLATIGLMPILSCVVLAWIPAPDSEAEKYRTGFERIRVGMPRKQVESIFGNDGIAIFTLDRKTNKWREDRYWGPFNVVYDQNALIAEKYEVRRDDSAFQNLYLWYRHIFLD